MVEEEDKRKGAPLCLLESRERCHPTVGVSDPVSRHSIIVTPLGSASARIRRLVISPSFLLPASGPHHRTAPASAGSSDATFILTPWGNKLCISSIEQAYNPR